MKYRVTLGGRTLEVELLPEAGAIMVNGQAHRAELRPVSGSPLRILQLDQATWTLPLIEQGPGAWVIQETGQRYEVEVVDERTAHIRGLAGTGAVFAGPKALKAPMPGLVVRVVAETGQAVAPGTSLVVLEAMKMENDLKASGIAVVDQVLVTAGQTVEKGAVLVTFRP
ncbi:MAG TPA: biotin/lipoyl-containing protein [Gemmatimonadales bacterium]|nr:biotin/lipoyl-containing protein [Gemmatimonadales bacterium]